MTVPAPKTRLLLVEDNLDQARLITRALTRRNPAIEITHVETGPACLEQLGRASFDLMLLDYNLPGANGLDLLRRIKADNYELAVIMVTGQGDERVAVESMKMEAYDYVIKSKNYLETLPVVVENVLEKHRLGMRLRESERRMRRLYEVSLAVTKQRDLAAVSQSLADGARALFGTCGAVVLVAEPTSGGIRLVAASGLILAVPAAGAPIAAAGLFGISCSDSGPAILDDPESHPLWRHTPPTNPAIEALMTVPISLRDSVLGSLVVTQRQDRVPYRTEDLDLLSALAVHAGAAIDNARVLKETETAAITDGLTGCFNHREFQRRLAEEVERGERFDDPFGLLLLDIDHFKTFNDRYGHLAGDAILKKIVQVMLTTTRRVDMAFRYGGDEFALLLPQTTEKGAGVVAERICSKLAEAPFALPSGETVRVSVSIGVCLYPVHASTAQDMIAGADRALYRAKQHGRARFEVCGDAGAS